MRFMRKCMVMVLCVSMLLSQTVILASACDENGADTQTVIDPTDTTNAVQPTVPADEEETAADADALLLSADEDEGETADAEVSLLAADDGWAASAVTDWYNETDTSFTLTTAAQLAGVAKLVNSGTSFEGKTILLGENIDLTGKEWTPIGVARTSSGSTFVSPFKGTLNGQGHTISGLTITEFNGTTTYEGYGLIGAASAATVQNLTVTGSITGTLPASTRQYVGAVVGLGYKSTVKNVVSKVNISVTGSANYAIVGGVIGGGLTTANTIQSCQNHGSVALEGGSFTYAIVGGIAGGYYTSPINCLNTGNISNTGTASYSCTGGITGYLDNSCTIKNCLSIAASVSGGIYPGLIVGYNNFYYLYNSYALTQESLTELSGHKVTPSVYVLNCGTLTALNGEITPINTTDKVYAKESYNEGETQLLYALNQYVQDNPTLGLKTWALNSDSVPAPDGDALKLAAPISKVDIAVSAQGVTGDALTDGSANKGDTVTLTASVTYDQSDPDKNQTSNVTYQWYSASVEGKTYAIAIEGATEASYTFTAPNRPGKTFYYVAVTNEQYTKETGASELLTVTVLADESDGNGWFGDTEDFALKDAEAAPSAENPFLIDTPAKLAKLAQLVNEGESFTGADGQTYSYASVYYQQTAELDMNNNDLTPIGTADSPFLGYYDGNGYKITNFFTNGVQTYVGLFGCVTGGEIKNLNVTGVIKSYHQNDVIRYMGVIGSAENAVLTNLTVDITIQHFAATAPSSAKTVYMGAVAGKLSGTAAKNLTVKSNIDVIYSQGYTGGAVGYMAAESTLDNVKVEIDLDPTVIMTEGSSSYTSGAVGYITTGSISGVTVTGAIKEGKPRYFGGVAGYATGAVLTDCTNKAAITVSGIGTTSYWGGVLGYAGEKCVLTDLTNAGSITIEINASYAAYIGGVLGGDFGGYVTLTDAVNDGNITVTVTATSSQPIYLGGVQGYMYRYATIARCRNNGAVTLQNAEGVTGSYGANLGGVIGYSGSASYTVAVSSLINTGAVTISSTATGSAIAGGIMGWGNDYGLRNSVNTGAVSVTSAGTVWAGGLLGYAANTIVNSVNTGAVSAATAEGKTCEVYQLAGYYNTSLTPLAKNSFYTAGDTAPAAEDAGLEGVGSLNTDGTVTFPDGSTGLYPTLTDAKAMLNQYLLKDVDGYSALWATERENGPILPVGAVLTPAAEPVVTTSENVITTVGGEAAITASVSVPKNATGTTVLTYQWYSAPLANTDIGEKVEGAFGTVTLTGDETLTGTVTLTVPTTEGGKTFYYLEVTNTVTNTQDGQSGSCTATVNSDFVSVVVNGTDGKYYGTVAEGFAGGTGTEDDPYQIATEAQLAYMNQMLSADAAYRSVCYVLTANLDFNNQVFQPMTAFTGVFDGGGHTISNLRIVSLNKAYSGFFQTLSSGAAVKDLTLEGGVLELPGSRGYIGTLAGYMSKQSTISNVHSSMEIDCTEVQMNAGEAYYIGGLVGGMVGASATSPVVTENVIDASSYSGSIYMPGGNINLCYMGGIVGYQNGAYALAASEFGNTIRNCYNAGDITVGNLTATNGAYVGGVVGYCYGPVLNCANLGTITADHADGKYCVSGLAGYMLTGTGVGGNTNKNDIGTVRNSVNYGKLIVTGEVTENYLNGIAYVSTGSAVVADSYSVPLDNAKGGIVYAPNTTSSGIGPGSGSTTTASSSVANGVLNLTDGSLTAAVNAGTGSTFVLNYPRPSVLDNKYTDLYYALNNGASYAADARSWQTYGEDGIILVPTGEVVVNPLGDFAASASGSYQELIAGELEEVSVAGKIFDYNYGAAEGEYAPVLTVSITGANPENTCYQWYRVTGDGQSQTTTLIEGATAATYTVDLPLTGAAKYYAVVVTVDEVSGYLSATRITDPVTIAARTADGSWQGVVASAESLQGSGTQDDPFLIPDGETLALLAQVVNNNNTYTSVADDGTSSELTYASACWKLTADINLNNYQWTPIGKSSTYNFAGTFDGDGHTISGLNVSGTSYQGFFGYVGSATIKDLVISGTVKATLSYAAGLVAYTNGSLTLENCGNEVNIESSSYVVGGLVGYAKCTTGTLTMTGCYNTGTVKTTGTSSMSFGIGGLLGYLYEATSTITDCYNTGAIIQTSQTGTQCTGGLVGYVYKSSASYTTVFNNCYNAGEITVGNPASNYRGALVGLSAPSDYVTLTNCYYLTSVFNTENTGAGIPVADAELAGLTAKLNGEDGTLWVETSTQVTFAGEHATAMVNGEAVTAAVTVAGCPVLSWEENPAQTFGGVAFTVQAANGYEIVSVTVGDETLIPVDGVYTVSITGDTEITITAQTYTVVAQGRIENIISSVAGGTQAKDVEGSTYDEALDYNDDGLNDLLDILDILYRMKDQETETPPAEEPPVEEQNNVAGEDA